MVLHRPPVGLVCRGCDRALDIDGGDVDCGDIDCGDEPGHCLAPEGTAGFVVDSVQIVFRGWCPDCRRSARRADGPHNAVPATRNPALDPRPVTMDSPHRRP